MSCPNLARSAHCGDHYTTAFAGLGGERTGTSLAHYHHASLRLTQVQIWGLLQASTVSFSDRRANETDEAMESTYINDHSLDSQSRFGEIVTVLAVFSVLSTAAVALRVFARWRLLHTFGLDDAVMMLAQVRSDVIPMLVKLLYPRR